MNINNKNLNRVIIEAMDLYDNNYPVDKIIKKYPKYKNILKDIFNDLSVLKNNTEKINPPKKLLKNILSKTEINKTVTKEEDKRYILYSKNKENILNNLINNFNVMKNKALIQGLTIILLIILLGGGIFLLSGDKKIKISKNSIYSDLNLDTYTEDSVELNSYIDDNDLSDLEEGLLALAETNFNGMSDEEESESKENQEQKHTELINLEQKINDFLTDINNYSNDSSELLNAENNDDLNDFDSNTF